MPVSPYLYFAGNCAEALSFYEIALDAKVEFRMKFNEAPESPPAPAGWDEKICHASFTILGTCLMASDAPPGMYNKPAGFRIALNMEAMDAPNTAKTWFEALAAGGSIDMPLQKTFWASAFGMLTDRFGIPWMINCP
jgi:PhnB protein